MNSLKDVLTTQKTQLTANSIVVATINGDRTHLNFKANGVSYWQSFVSPSSPDKSLGGNVGSGIVTFHKGMELRYVPQGNSMFQVLFSGEITDNGSANKFTGMVIASGTC